MITQIGIAAGKIFNLLDKNNGVIPFGGIHSAVNEPRDFVLMSLGELLHNGHVYIMEDPLRAVNRDNFHKKAYNSEACLFDLVVKTGAGPSTGKRLKEMAIHLSIVADKIVTLLEACGDLLALGAIEGKMNEHRDVILMALGWLIREGYVRAVTGSNEIFIFRLPKNASDLKVYAHS